MAGWDQVANAAASGLMAACSAVFIGVYRRRAPWRASAMGRHLVAVAATLGGLGLYTVAVTVWPDGALACVLRLVRTLLLLVMAALMVQRTAMVLRAQRDQDRSGS